MQRVENGYIPYVMMDWKRPRGVVSVMNEYKFETGKNVDSCNKCEYGRDTIY